MHKDIDAIAILFDTCLLCHVGSDPTRDREFAASRVEDREGRHQRLKLFIVIDSCTGFEVME